MKLAEDLVPKTVDIKDKEIGDMVEKEMSQTTAAIEQAAKRIEVRGGGGGVWLWVLAAYALFWSCVWGMGCKILVNVDAVGKI